MENNSNKVLLEQALNKLDAVFMLPFNSIIRDAAIQRFKYTYQLSRKLIDESLRLRGFEESNLARIYHQAAKQNLVNSEYAWLVYHKARGLASQGYNDSTANLIYLVADTFMNDVKKLLVRL